jgi:hypothetical protein
VIPNASRDPVSHRTDVFEPRQNLISQGYRRDVSVDSPQPSCTVCGLTIISGEVVVFDQDELIHVDCHWDHATSRRPLSRAMRWPR